MSSFDFDTIKDFDNHINNSIMGYDLLHNLIINLSEFFIQKNSILPIVDLGCTSGKLLQMIKERWPFLNCKGYDKTDHNFLHTNDIELIKADITNINFPKSQIFYSIFTLQFIEIDKRQDILKRICKSLYPNGVFFFCEKEYAQNAKFQEVYTFANYSNKQKSFSHTEILEKEKDIRTLMSPLNEHENKIMLKTAGFKHIDIFFKSLNFTGYICQK